MRTLNYFFTSLTVFFLFFYPLQIFNQVNNNKKGQIIIPIDSSPLVSNGNRNEKPPDSAAKLLANIKKKRFSGKTININFKDADVKDIMSIFSRISQIDIKIDPVIDEQMTCTAKNIPWDQAFDFFLRENRLVITLKNNSLIINKIPPDIKPTSLFYHFYTIILPLLLFLLLIMASIYIFYFSKRQKIKTKPVKNHKTITFPQEKAKEYVKQIVDLFETQQIYRDENLSLQKLSQHLSAPAYQVSQVINDKLQKTFFELLNFYRVEEVKKRLSHPAEKDNKLLDIAFDAGFKTKTAFNRTFKKYTGMTPTQYQEKK
jgi:AraC-like DNA-binding protein